MRGEQAIFNLEIKKKSGLRLNPDIHHSKVFSSALIKRRCSQIKPELKVEIEDGCDKFEQKIRKKIIR